MPRSLHLQLRCLPPMATDCRTAARRLSDLLQEQQEPFLLLHLLQDHDESTTPARTPTAASVRTRNLLRGSTATITKLALRWAEDVLTGCFPFPCPATPQRLRRLPRPDRDISSAAADCYDGGHGAGVHCGRQQLSPVSVLDLHSDDESSAVPSQPSHTLCFFPNNNAGDERSDDDGNGKPSTSGAGTSAPSIHSHNVPGKTPATGERFQGKSVVSTWEWESVAADISRIPSLVEPDLSASRRDDWRCLVVAGAGCGDEEARLVAQSIEAMIFEEVRWEAVRDMLCSPQY